MSYYYISQYQGQVPGSDGAAGRIIMPRGVQAVTLDRRHRRISGQTSLFNETPPDNHEPALLLDPQLYLGELSCDTCSDVCASLVGYPWFARGEPAEYDSGKITQHQYKEMIRSHIRSLWRGLPTSEADIAAATAAAIEYQTEIGCDAIILPSPLTTDPGTTYARELEWLDAGLRQHSELAPRTRCLATVAISDICTFSAKPETNRLLELILDQVSAREPWGVYLVLEQRIEQGYYISSSNTIRTLLQLVAEFRAGGIDHVLVSWIGTAGLLAMAVGATGWASGWYRSERRLKLDDLLDDSGGPAKPAFYSHPLASELHPTDLERARDAGMLDLVADVTPWSEGLLRALRDGKKIQDVEAWTNHAARAHFNAVAVRETASLKVLDLPQRADRVAIWLQEAAQLAKQLSDLGTFHQRSSLTHQDTWSAAFANRAKANET